VKVLIFGATGMVGQGVLRECLRDPEVELTMTVGRRVTGVHHPRIREVVHTNLADYSGLEGELGGFDACFFCLGMSSAGMTEADYARVTYDLALAAGEALSRAHPGMTFIYVSGVGTDSTEQGRAMWARVKGRTENALLRLPLKAYMLRPGLIQPLDGIQSRTPAYRVIYSLGRPLIGLLRWALPNQVITTRELGQAMLEVARHGYPKRILETQDLRVVAQAGAETMAEAEARGESRH
jgi:uncharacterized protein YbjT (DUF2867 family)